MFAYNLILTWTDAFRQTRSQLNQLKSLIRGSNNCIILQCLWEKCSSLTSESGLEQSEMHKEVVKIKIKKIKNCTCYSSGFLAMCLHGYHQRYFEWRSWCESKLFSHQSSGRALSLFTQHITNNIMSVKMTEWISTLILSKIA